MECPECRLELVEERHGHVVVDHCRGCGGIWFDAEEIAEFVRSRLGRTGLGKARDSDFEDLTGFAAGRCPRCLSDTLRLGLHRDLSFERCDRCRGFFLTARQIQDILIQEQPYSPRSLGLAVAGMAADGANGEGLAAGLEASIELLVEFIVSALVP